MSEAPSNIQLISKAESPAAMQDAISRFVRMIGELPPEKQVEVETMHHFVGDIYARTVFVKADTVVCGYTHKKECLVIVSLGSATVATSEGVVELRAPAIFVAPAGVQRVGYHHTDTVWTTVHMTKERDIDKIEAELFDLSLGEK